MKILFVTYNSYLRNTTRMLDALLSGSTGIDPVFLFRDKGPWQQTLAQRGIPCYYSDTLSAVKSPRKMLSLASRIAWIVRRHRIDIVHCNEHDHYPALRRILKFLNVPCVVTCRFILSPGYAQWALSTPYQPTMLQFTSEYSRNQILSVLSEEIDPSKTAIVMNGLNVSAFLAKQRPREETRQMLDVGPGQIVLGTAGAIHPRKKLDHFVKLVGELVRSGKNATGLIAGFEEKDRELSQSYRTSVTNQIRQAGLEHHVRFVGPYDEMASFLASIDLYVSTSEIETFGMSVCEAMACGTPVVAYDVGSLGEVVPEQEMLVPYDDLSGLFNATVKLLDKPRDGWSHLTDHVRSNFDCANVAERQFDVYRSIISSEKREICTELTAS